MRMINKAAVVMAIVIMGIGLRSACAWNPVIHYLTAEEVKVGLGKYANLPDYHDNKGAPIFIFAGSLLKLKNTPEFCWSHGVISSNIAPTLITNTRLWLDYQPDNGEPGSVMAELVKNKICTNRFLTLENRTAVAGTINGFRAHNAADRVVHFNFFIQDSQENWVVHHGWKEIYAEYLMLRINAFGNNTDLMFTSTGGNINRGAFATNSLLYPSETLDGIPFLTASDDETKMTAKLMCLAQQVYQKNRQIWNRDLTLGPFGAATVNTIKSDLLNAREEQNVKSGKTYWERDQWGIWTKAGVTVLVGWGGSSAYTNAAGPQLAQRWPGPSSLKGEYEQLLGWYEWSRATHTNGAAQYWDNDQIQFKYDKSVTTINDVVKTDAELLP